jgi:hypothetical protein
VESGSAAAGDKMGAGGREVQTGRSGVVLWLTSADVRGDLRGERFDAASGCLDLWGERGILSDPSLRLAADFPLGAT